MKERHHFSAAGLDQVHSTAVGATASAGGMQMREMSSDMPDGMPMSAAMTPEIEPAVTNRMLKPLMDTAKQAPMPNQAMRMPMCGMTEE